jgi:hypothetical protein
MTPTLVSAVHLPNKEANVIPWWLLSPVAQLPRSLMSSITAIPLSPLPGFCVKTKALQETVVPGTATSASSDALGTTPNAPIALKVFINIAWDANVPPPPLGSEDAIQKAMRGEDFDELNPNGWFVPVIVSDLRDDKDKGRCCSTRLMATSSLKQLS